MEINIIHSIEPYTYLALFLLWVASIILLRSIFSKTPSSSSKLRLPPSPLGLPFIGHFHLLRPPLHQTFHKLSSRYGPILLLYLGSLPCIVVSSAELAKHIFKTHDISFSNRPANAAISYLTFDASDFAFAPYGTYWKFMKKLCMTQLLNGVMLDRLLPVRQEEINHFLEVILKKAEAGEAVNLGSEVARLSSSISVRMSVGKESLFKSKSEEEAREMSERMKESARLCGRFNLGDYFGIFKRVDVQGIGKKLKQFREESDAMFEGIIREHEDATTIHNKPKDDILDLLLTLSQDPTSEVKITRNNIKGFMTDITTGGTGTIAIGIEWAMAELINHPDIMEKARKEIDSVIGKERIVKESDIIKLPYLQAIVKETLRLHPPAPLILRESTENCKIGGYDIPEKTRVFINVWAIGRDPQYWENPVEFRPERFMIEDDKRRQIDVRGQHYSVLPFGSGRRGCPGASLALNILHTSVGAMIQCFEWKADDRVDMEEGHAVDLQRAKPLISTPKPRLTPFPSFSSS